MLEYKGYEILAKVVRTEAWSLNEDGSLRWCSGRAAAGELVEYKENP